MSAAIADLVDAHLEGQLLASRFIESIVRTTQHPDALCQAFSDLALKPDVRRGFARQLQKHLERESASMGAH